MITFRPHADLGRLDISWLSARYHFSFAGYHDPAWMGLSHLRVINDDTVRGGGGFDFHPHKDMEIITYVRSGAITHEDSLGNHGITHAGEVQVMSAGTGIIHAERNETNEDTRLYQIWIAPHTQGVSPRWEHRPFPASVSAQGLNLLVSGMPEDADKGALFIHQHARVWGGKLATGTAIRMPLSGHAYILISEGSLALDGRSLRAGDGAMLLHEPNAAFTAHDTCELLLIELPSDH